MTSHVELNHQQPWDSHLEMPKEAKIKGARVDQNQDTFQ